MTLPSPETPTAVIADRYEILGPHGDEALGRVWSARDQKNGRLVLVKILTPDLAAEPERLARFAREMTASFAVTDPNTLEVLDYGEDHGAHFLVLEYIAGTPLSEVLASGPLSPDRCARIAAQIARALGAAHVEGVVHRSLSPDTVLLLDNAVDGDFVKVRDFGLSKFLQPDGLDATPGEPEITDSGLRLGDARYMPPEYIVQGEFGPKGDLYALGALLYHMLTGQPPFTGSRRDILARHVSGAVPKPTDRVPDIPAWLDRVVVILLDKAPDRRPVVHDLLTRIEQGLGGEVRLPALAPLDARGRAIARRRHVQDLPTARGVAWGIPGLGGAGTLVLLVLLALVGVMVYTMATPS